MASDSSSDHSIQVLAEYEPIRERMTEDIAFGFGSVSGENDDSAIRLFGHRCSLLSVHIAIITYTFLDKVVL